MSHFVTILWSNGCLQTFVLPAFFTFKVIHGVLHTVKQELCCAVEVKK